MHQKLGGQQMVGNSGMVLSGSMSHSTHYRSFWRRFYRSDDPTNSVIALKDDSLPGQGPIPQAQQTER